jgi:hypothetical protein
MALTIEQIYVYLALTILISVIYAATLIVLLQKYKERKNRAHLWASAAFIMLLFQEIIVCYWMVAHLFGVYSLYARPFYLQAISVLFSLLLLGFSITGKIKD